MSPKKYSPPLDRGIAKAVETQINENTCLTRQSMAGVVVVRKWLS